MRTLAHVVSAKVEAKHAVPIPHAVIVADDCSASKFTTKVTGANRFELEFVDLRHSRAFLERGFLVSPRGRNFLHACMGTG